MSNWRRVVSCAAAVAATWTATSCGGSGLAVPATEPEVEVTDYATLPPPTTTIAPTTTLPPQPGSILTSEATYVVIEGDFPFQVAARFEVDFEEFVTLNGWTIVDGQVPDWPIPGTPIRIPTGAKVPGGNSVLVPVATTTTTIDPLAPPAGGSAGSIPAGDTASTLDPAEGDGDGTGDGCGTYTVTEGDYPVLVATKLDTTVDKLNDANADTSGYGAFYVGLEIAVPC